MLESRPSASSMNRPITILGIFVADLAFRTPRLPVWGETVLGSDFKLGPGGKGSNQAVAAARLGASVTFLSKVGDDDFAAIARKTYKEEGVDTAFLFTDPVHPTGGASIVVDEKTGENAIVVVTGACDHLTTAEIDKARERIAGSAMFMTQLEQPLPLALHALKIARDAGVPTLLNPAPAPTTKLPDSIFPLCDYLTPNESEAAALVGFPVKTIEDAHRAADVLLQRGVHNVVITLGPQGAYVKNDVIAVQVAAYDAGPVVETTGAGDAFNGGFAVAIAEGKDIVAAARFGCATAGISVTRAGTAPSMPKRAEVEALLKK